MSNSASEPTTIVLMAQVHPRSRRNRISLSGDELHVWVTAPPVEGAANDAVIALIAATLEIPRRQVQILRGATARHKRIAILHAKITDADPGSC